MRLPILFFCTLGSASAAVISVTDSTATAIPDGSSAGVVRSLTVSAPGQNIVSAEVDVDLSSFSVFDIFLGDLYFYLQHDADLAILVNRPGRRAGAPAGYGDNQSMNVTFTMLATNDFHNYRLNVTGSHAIPLSGPLTGSWQPDGRAVDPAVVLDSSLRTAGLDVFNGDTASGTWNLFAADLSTGSLHQINSWTLRLDVIPEPGSSVLLLAAAALTIRRRR